MTGSIQDNVEVTLFIGGDATDRLEWNVIDMTVEHTQSTSPNYCKGVISPQTDLDYIIERGTGRSSILDDGDTVKYIGEPVELYADNDLISERDTDAEEDSLLFRGNVANIAPTGESVFSVVFFDPSQEPFSWEGERGSSGSLLSQTVDFDALGIDIITEEQIETDNPYSYSKPLDVSEIIERVITNPANGLGLNERNGIVNIINDEDDFGSYKNLSSYDPLETEYVIELVTAQNNDATLGRDSLIIFDATETTFKELFDKAKRYTNAEYWFDKYGAFHFGVPSPVKHDLQYITETSAGLTTPPYQSVRVVSSGNISTDRFNYNAAPLIVGDDDQVTVEARIGKKSVSPTEDEELYIVFGETQPPIFEYKDYQISTVAQALQTAESLLRDMAKQQADGEITVVGFPEVEIFDGVVMPSSPEQPMGGATYGVYKVTHYLNNSEGFLTKINVAAPTSIERDVVGRYDVAISIEENAGSITTQDVDRFGPGAGEGEDLTLAQQRQLFREVDERLMQEIEEDAVEEADEEEEEERPDPDEDGDGFWGTFFNFGDSGT